MSMHPVAARWFWLGAYDLRLQVREPATWALLAVALVLALLALRQGDSFQRAQQQAVALAMDQQQRAQEQAQAEATRYFAHPEDPQYAKLRWWRTAFDLRGYAFREHLGYAVRPALPGAALSIGQADVLPAVVRVRAENMASVRQSGDIEHPMRLAAGRYDLGFFVTCLWPLVLLALTLSALTQDREKRRLPVLALQGAAAHQLLLAQVLARVLAATALLVAVVAVAALALGALPATAAGLAALAAWGAVVLALSLFWAGVAALVCARSATPTTAAFAGFAAWVLLVVLLPALLAAAVSLAAPAPSRESHVVAMRDATDSVQNNRLALLQRFYDQHPEWRPERTGLDKLPAATTRLTRAAEVERELAGVEASFAEAQARQARLWQGLGLLSPVSLGHELLARQAGHDAGRHQRFIAEVGAHQRQLREFFQARIQQAARSDERQPCPTTCAGGWGFADFAQVPRFEASAALARAPSVLPRAVVLAGWGLLLLGAAAWLTQAHRRVR